MPNDSSSRYSSSIEKFINSAIANDYYIGLGVESIGYEDHDTRLNKKVSNVASLIKRVKISEINAAFERNSWSEGKSFKVFDSTDIVAQQLHDVLFKQNLLRPESSNMPHEFYVSDYTPSFEQTARLFFGNAVALNHSNIWA